MNEEQNPALNLFTVIFYSSIYISMSISWCIVKGLIISESLYRDIICIAGCVSRIISWGTLGFPPVQTCSFLWREHHFRCRSIVSVKCGVWLSERTDFPICIYRQKCNTSYDISSLMIQLAGGCDFWTHWKFCIPKSHSISSSGHILKMSSGIIPLTPWVSEDAFRHWSPSSKPLTRPQLWLFPHCLGSSMQIHHPAPRRLSLWTTVVGRVEDTHRCRHTHTHTEAHTCKCTHAFMVAHTPMQPYTATHVHKCKLTHNQTYTRECKQTNMQTHANTRKNANTHERTHQHAHTGHVYT